MKSEEKEKPKRDKEVHTIFDEAVFTAFWEVF